MVFPTLHYAVTDWAGAPLTLESDGTVLAAATPELHQAALHILND